MQINEVEKIVIKYVTCFTEIVHQDVSYLYLYLEEQRFILSTSSASKNLESTSPIIA